MKICTHCGAGILEPNKPWIHRGKIVCRHCFENLSPPKAAGGQTRLTATGNPHASVQAVGELRPAKPESAILQNTPGEAGESGRPLNGYGLAALIIAVMGIFCAGLVSPIGLVMSLVGLRFRPRGLAIMAVIISALGTLYLIVWICLNVISWRHVHPVR
ncbi:MAG: hypothetical protein HKL95_00600 [Phycisphaerae bacterium]|nr:hypothetical protein [Phycisphaerae bacterium]